MNKLIYIFSIIMIFSSFTNGQNIDEEIGFKYVKAEYLVSTERMEEAIKELNDIIKVNPIYKDALMLRAETRYKLGAFKGAKTDIIESISTMGITANAAALLGKTEYALGNQDPALNSLTAAIALNVQDERLYELRAAIFEDKGQLMKACLDWEAAARMGSTKGAIKARKLCGQKVENNDPPVTKQEEKNKEEETPPSNNEDQKLPNKNDTQVILNPPNNGNQDLPSDEPKADEDVVIEEPKENLPPEDNYENLIEIDEDLTLSIYGQGLGRRRVLDRPSILILSDETGSVTVEVCINENGKVEFAEYIADKSSLSKNSLVSLAIRKSKEFWFEKSEYNKQCGYIVFKIKGSE